MTDGYVGFSREAFAAFRADDRPGPVQMLNLIRLRERAAYGDGHPPSGEPVSGREAYEAYSRLSAPVFRRLGGRIVWRGGFELTLIGPAAEAWDIAFVAEYPSVAAFAEMIRDPDYRAAMRHRQAAVADSRLVRFAASPPGASFAGGPD